jgi:phosphoribosyl 1,2-cyclic phosphodiesterase
LLVDCGRDWLAQLPHVDVEALLLTLAHPDHTAGLRGGCPWPVHASEETRRALRSYPLEQCRLVRPREAFSLAGMRVEAFPVEHSLRAPTVAYRITAGRVAILYAPDVAAVAELADALAGVTVYVGDGAAISRSIIRRRDGASIGHASIRAQLDWCAEQRVRRAVFTHCGSQILRDEARTAKHVEELGVERGVRARIAYDGLEVSVR